VTFLQVIGRYTPLPFSSKFEEIAVSTFVWMTLLGSASCIHTRIHMKMDFFVARLSKNKQNYVGIWHHLIVFVFSVGVVYVSCKLIPLLKKTGMQSASLQWPLWIFYTALPVCFILMSFWGLIEIINDIRAIISQRQKRNDMGADTN
jgi:TRAP-type C4-dicarboxylate transport system permease small subunit